jgi:hypothetical protein
MCGIHLKLSKKNRKITTCDRLDLETLGFWLIMPKDFPGHWSYDNIMIKNYLSNDRWRKSQSFTQNWKIKSHFFQNICREVWTSYRFLMLSHNSNMALQFILSNSIPHKDTCIKASKVSNFNEARKWLLIAFFVGNPLSHIPILDDKYFFPQVSWDVVNWYNTHWCLDKIAIPHTKSFVFTFMPQSFYKLKQMSSTYIAFNCHQHKCLWSISPTIAIT